MASTARQPTRICVVLSPDWRHISCFSGGELRPSLHELAPAVEQIRSVVDRFGLVSKRVGKGGFTDGSASPLENQLVASR